MADITLSTATVVRPYTQFGGCPRIVHLEESTYASTAPIAFGNVVVLDEATATAAHRIVRASTGANRQLSTSIVGVSAEGSTGIPTTPGPARTLPVYAADGNTEFLFPFKGTVASSHVNTLQALSWDSTNNHHFVEVNSTAAACRVYITAIPDLAQVNGDTNGFYVGQFASTAVVPAVRAR